MEILQSLTNFSGVNLTSLFVAALSVVILVSLASQWFSRKKSKQKYQVKDGFININFRILHDSQKGLRLGYLRSVTPHHATLIAPHESVPKGTLLDLALPVGDGKNSKIGILGKVVRSSSLGGEPESWLINIQFLEKNVPNSTAIVEYFNNAKKAP